MFLLHFSYFSGTSRTGSLQRRRDDDVPVTPPTPMTIGARYVSVTNLFCRGLISDHEDVSFNIKLTGGAVSPDRRFERSGPMLSGARHAGGSQAALLAHQGSGAEGLMGSARWLWLCSCVWRKNFPLWVQLMRPWHPTHSGRFCDLSVQNSITSLFIGRFRCNFRI